MKFIMNLLLLVVLGGILSNVNLNIMNCYEHSPEMTLMTAGGVFLAFLLTRIWFRRNQSMAEFWATLTAVSSAIIFLMATSPYYSFEPKTYLVWLIATFYCLAVCQAAAKQGRQALLSFHPH